MRTKIIILLLVCFAVACACSACTQYERDGMNPKPFNSPSGWEYNPYGIQIQN